MKFIRRYLPNVALPFLFFEVWYVLIAFLFVVLIEALIIKIFIKENFIRLFKVLLKANFWTTIVGYGLQGVLRIIIGFIAFASIDKITDNKIFNSIVGNIGIPDKSVHKNSDMITLTLVISMAIALIISIVVERRILIKEFEGMRVKNISISVTIANIISYILLFLWVYFSYLRFIKA
ncbi:MAG: hypothetical protein JWQ09_56 [Segetibacter sp.]|nr:hypothetical protein [Segetibacter sp.]